MLPYSFLGHGVNLGQFERKQCQPMLIGVGMEIAARSIT